MRTKRKSTELPDYLHDIVMRVRSMEGILHKQRVFLRKSTQKESHIMKVIGFFLHHDYEIFKIMLKKPQSWKNLAYIEQHLPTLDS